MSQEQLAEVLSVSAQAVSKWQNEFSVDINYGIDNAMRKILDAEDEMILIKDTLSSGKTLKTSSQRIKQEVGKEVS